MNHTWQILPHPKMKVRRRRPILVVVDIRMLGIHTFDLVIEERHCLYGIVSKLPSAFITKPLIFGRMHLAQSILRNAPRMVQLQLILLLAARLLPIFSLPLRRLLVH